MARQIIRFSDEPVTLKLDDHPENARETESGFGRKEWQHRANEDAAMFYLPEAGQAALLESGARAGNTVSIAKARRGNRVEWLIEVEGQSQAQAQKNPMPVAVQTPLVVSPPKERMGYQPATQGATALAPVPAEVNGRLARPAAKALAGALCAAIDAIAEAREYAQRKNITLQFNADDVRALASTLYIQASKEGTR